MQIAKVNMSPIVRALFIVSAVVVLATSATFALLSDNAVLASNTISSDTADLQVSNGGAFNETVNGFEAENVVPGEGETFSFYLKNGSDFDMNVSVAVPSAPTYDGISSWEDVHITIAGDDGVCAEEISTDMAALLAGQVELPCNELEANSQGSAATQQEGNYTLTFDLDPAGVDGESATIDAFDLVFTGEQAVVEEAPEVL